MSIRVEFPDELLVATREDPQAFTRKVMIYTQQFPEGDDPQ